MRLLCPLLALTTAAGALEVKGRVTEFWAKNSFTVTKVDEVTKLWFDVPSRSHVGLTVEHGGEQVRSGRLSASGPVDLSGAGEFNVTVAWDSLNAGWGCRVIAGAEPVLTGVTAYADTLFPFRFSFVTEEDPAKWQFTYPREATFIVKQTAPGMAGAEYQDLDDDPVVTCVGGGRFTLEIAPTDDGGEFAAKLVRLDAGESVTRRLTVVR